LSREASPRRKATVPDRLSPPKPRSLLLVTDLTGLERTVSGLTARLQAASLTLYTTHQTRLQRRHGTQPPCMVPVPTRRVEQTQP
jgi:hypothetical protein